VFPHAMAFSEEGGGGGGVSCWGTQEALPLYPSCPSAWRESKWEGAPPPISRIGLSRSGSTQTQKERSLSFSIARGRSHSLLRANSGTSSPPPPHPPPPPPKRSFTLLSLIGQKKRKRGREFRHLPITALEKRKEL